MQVHLTTEQPPNKRATWDRVGDDDAGGGRGGGDDDKNSISMEVASIDQTRANHTRTVECMGFPEWKEGSGWEE